MCQKGYDTKQKTGRSTHQPNNVKVGVKYYYYLEILTILDLFWLTNLAKYLWGALKHLFVLLILSLTNCLSCLVSTLLSGGSKYSPLLSLLYSLIAKLVHNCNRLELNLSTLKTLHALSYDVYFSPITIRRATFCILSRSFL